MEATLHKLSQNLPRSGFLRSESARRAARCLLEMSLLNFQVMLPRRAFRIAQPLTDHVQRKVRFEFCLTAGSAVLVEPWNLVCDDRPRQNSHRLRPEIALFVDVSKNLVLPLVSQFVSIKQVRAQLRENWNDSLFFSAVFSLRRMNDESVFVPKKMAPTQSCELGGTSQSSVTGECDD